jgi:hypothetical protein
MLIIGLVSQSRVPVALDEKVAHVPAGIGSGA